jgi:hypothetical protein
MNDFIKFEMFQEVLINKCCGGSGVDKNFSSIVIDKSSEKNQ